MNKFINIFLLLLIGCGQGGTTSSGIVTSKIDCGSSDSISEGDPLAGCSWHLLNSEQSAFSDTGGSAGVDLNMLQTEINNTSGAGVKVLVSDTGLEIAHEDLQSNVLSGLSKNYVNSTTDPTNTTGTGDHGTSVAGVIAATKDNNIGGRGVAAGAAIAGYNFLRSQSSANQIDQADGSDNFDIVNQSWGYSDTQIITIEADYLAQLKYATTNYRSNKGLIYVKAVGNNFEYDLNGNTDPYNATPYTINVAAINADGDSASYSSLCSCNWVSAPGGETGVYSPAIITTDQSTCQIGYSKYSSASGSFDLGRVNNDSCNYTSIFNGTSAAAPAISGVIALMLEANSDLTWRDVRYILASTAEKINPDLPNYGSSDVSGIPSGHIWEQAWVTNAAGFNFHNWFGFGLVDTDAAVAMASSYSIDLGTYVDLDWSYSDTTSRSIPDNSAAGVTDSITVSESLTVEAIQLRVNITHQRIPHIGVELTSPAGTKSILLNVNNGLSNSTTMTDMVLLSNAFYGENSNGDWTIKIVDGTAGYTGTLTKWELNISGR
ncbi:MAG: S8 family serine peptidase [Bacteriovoracaceae bacterium]|nr:S8 family serine peptidase [Bacteriovoracaceae bacterium]